MFIPQGCRLLLVKEPVSGRFGIPKLIAQLSYNKYNINWDGFSPIAVVFFNKRRSIGKLLIIDKNGASLLTRILNIGKFQIEFNDKGIPQNLTKSMLESLFLTGKID